MKKRVLVVSSANMDITMPVRSMPAEGETLLCDGSISYSPGGKGANSAVTFAALGAETVFCARIGRDSHGETLYDYYKDVGIDVSHLVIDKDHATGCAAVVVESKGQNRILCYPGANKYLSESDVEEGFLSCPDALYLQMEIGQDAILAAANYAYRHEIPIFLDAGNVGVVVLNLYHGSIAAMLGFYADVEILNTLHQLTVADLLGQKLVHKLHIFGGDCVQNVKNVVCIAADDAKDSSCVDTLCAAGIGDRNGKNILYDVAAAVDGTVFGYLTQNLTQPSTGIGDGYRLGTAGSHFKL